MLARHEQMRSFYAIVYLAIKMQEAVDVTQVGIQSLEDICIVDWCGIDTFS